MKNKIDYFGENKGIRICFDISKWLLVALILYECVLSVIGIFRHGNELNILYLIQRFCGIAFSILLVFAIITIREKARTSITIAALAAAIVLCLVPATIDVIESGFHISTFIQLIFLIAEIASIYVIPKRRLNPAVFWILLFVGYAPSILFLGNILSVILFVICEILLFISNNLYGICTKCGFKNGRNVCFCGKCGNKL